jgi:hypothetical protein
VRVGLLLLYANDREALASFLDAWQQAEALADKAFGILDPVPVEELPRASAASASSFLAVASPARAWGCGRCRCRAC